MSSISVETSQNVQINYQLATLGQRVGAFLIDIVLLYISIFIVAVAFLVSFSSVFGGEDSLYFFVSMYLIVAFYHLGMEYFFNGQSVGKMILGIKVVRIDGEEPGFSNYFMRWMFRLVDITLTSGVAAIISIALTDKQQRIGDILGGTTVVRVRNQTASKRFHRIATDDSDDTAGRIAEVSRLTDTDVRKISDMYHKIVSGDHDYYARAKLMIQLKTATMKKLGLSQTDLESKDFIVQVLKDYRNYHRSGSAVNDEL
ncbi:MAG: RDD family protein [Balneolales bacterium]|nr:RDD family protein [Balneolales bacterium]